MGLTSFRPFFIGAFEDPDIIHVDDTVDPVRDLEVISAELRLKVCSLVPTILCLESLCFCFIFGNVCKN